jgi:glycosyltransferase involved in cell wall biosynthesis
VWPAMTDSVSIIIPVYNEAHTIGGLVKKIRAVYPHFEIIVINDGSSDETEPVAVEAGAIVYSHPYNIGNGAAIKTGIRLACGDILVFMDGDNQHDPKDIARMLKFFPAFDMVVGARKKDSRASLYRAVGNKIYNHLASYVAKFKVEDLTSGFRAVKATVARKFLYLLPNTYSYPTTLTLGVLRNGSSVKYVPITSGLRVHGKSQIRLLQDGVRFFMIIVKICTLFSPFRIFLPVSFFTFMTGFLYYLYTFLLNNRFTNMGVFLFTSAIIIFMMGLVSEQICQMRFEETDGHASRNRPRVDNPDESKQD